MDGIRMTATALCITAVITAVLFMLLPSEKYRGVMKFAVSLFLLCGLIAPFTGGGFSFSLDLPQTDTQDRTEKTVEAAQSYLAGMVEERLSLSLEEALALKGTKGVKIRADIHMEEDGSIFIDRITVLDCDEDDRPAVHAYIKEQTGVSPDFQAGA